MALSSLRANLGIRSGAAETGHEDTSSWPQTSHDTRFASISEWNPVCPRFITRINHSPQRATRVPHLDRSTNLALLRQSLRFISRQFVVGEFESVTNETFFLRPVHTQFSVGLLDRGRLDLSSSLIVFEQLFYIAGFHPDQDSAE